jgi:hypothetical protein
MSVQTLTKGTAALSTRQDFGGTEMELAGETAATAVAARMKAEVEAAYIMAMRRPRDFEDVRSRLLKDCRRPSFAAVAKYRKPIGNGIVGPSIRFAEAALRCMGNVRAETVVVYDDERKRILRVCVTDLEANISYPLEITIEKVVERHKTDGRAVVGERVNSEGKKVYQVLATDDEILNKQNALVSKALRTSGLRLLPGDILDEAMQQVDRTKKDQAAKDPDAEKRSLVDAFSAIGVSATDLSDYLGHSLDRVTPAELVELREVFVSVRDGEATWEAVMESKGPAAPKGSVEAAQDVAARKLAEMMKQKAPDATTAPAPTPEPAPENPTTEAAQEAPKAPRGNLQFGKKP